MIRGTTPTFVFKMGDDLDMTKIKEVYVTIKSLSKQITFPTDRCAIDEDEHTITLELSQEDTLLFETPSAKVQIRILDTDNLAYATPIKQISVDQILQEGVIGE